MFNLEDFCLNYVSPVNQNLLCSICRQPFIKPASLPCLHYFCKSCIEQALKIKSVCPIDRKVVPNDFYLESSSMIVNNLVDELEIYCVNKSEGCRNQLQRAQLISHLEKECLFKETKFNENLSDVESLRNCKHCKEKVRADVFVNHVLACPKFLVSCDFFEFGCTLQYPREVLLAHLEDCVYQKMSVYLLKQKEKMDSIETENKELKKTLGSILDTMLSAKSMLERLSEIEKTRQPVLTQSYLAEQHRTKLELSSLSQRLMTLEFNQKMDLLTETLNLREEMITLKSKLTEIQIQMVENSGNKSILKELTQLGIPESEKKDQKNDKKKDKGFSFKHIEFNPKHNNPKF